MSPSSAVRAAIVLVLAVAVAACGITAAARPDRTRRPAAPVAAVASASPSASPSPTNIPSARSLSYRGGASKAHEPVRLAAGTYRAHWSATATGADCVFRAEITSLADGLAQTVPATGQSPLGSMTEGSTNFQLASGPYAVVVISHACKWRLDVEPVTS